MNLKKEVDQSAVPKSKLAGRSLFKSATGIKHLGLFFMLLLGMALPLWSVYGQSVKQSKPFRWQMVHQPQKGMIFDRMGSAVPAIQWPVENGQVDPAQQAHTDHLEMSGKYTSSIITYGVDQKRALVIKRTLIFPMLRTIPNNTGGSLKQYYNQQVLAGAMENGRPVSLLADQFGFDGILSIRAHTAAGLKLEVKLFPSYDKAAYVEMYTLTNSTDKPVDFYVPALDSSRITAADKGVYGAYIIRSRYYADRDSAQLEQTIAPGARLNFSMVIAARKANRDPYEIAPLYELAKRERMLREISQNLVLKTPNDTINRMFTFAKIRAAESIFDTKGGLMHGPGGGAYYAAIWANDQAEYVSPFFPFLGYEEGNASAINCYRQFARFMNPAYKPLPSSIIAEGVDVWQGAGDRGDQAMIAYGATRFALANGDSLTARKVWPLIKWCFTYLERQKTSEGVIASNSDELEGRFPAGKVNLSTNCLAYAGYIDAAKLAKVLGEPSLAASYAAKAAALRIAIDRYFGHAVEGFNTYQYYAGNKKLRSWICLPLVVGISERKDATIKALLSPLLWSKEGILTESGSKTYWDRATLYAFRGLFDAGATDTCYKYFSYYSAMRLLGEHVPYAVEAWPEGDQRHLSAESGLYCRVVTEGLFGIQPMSFNSFTLAPRLPKGWQEMRLNHVMAFGHDFNIHIQRTKTGKAQVQVLITIGDTTIASKVYDGSTPVLITLPKKA